MDHVIFGCLGALLFSPALYTCANVLSSGTLQHCTRVQMFFLAEVSSTVNVPHRLARWACKCHVVRCVKHHVTGDVKCHVVRCVKHHVTGDVKCHVVRCVKRHVTGKLC